MKKYVLAIVICVLTLSFLSVFWFSYNQVNLVRQNLKITLDAIKVDKNTTNYQEFAKTFTDVRVTIIDEDGKVIADNRADASTMSNHSERKEFLQAKMSGYGEDIRVSETTNQKSIYVIMEIKDGIYMRLSQPAVLTYEFLLWLLFPILFLSLLLALFGLAFAKNKQTQKLRSEFVANVSHELKTPLTSIKGFSELVSAGLVKDMDTIKEYQSKIVSQSDRLIAMIDDILHLSKLENTKPKKLGMIDTYSVANQVKDNLKFIADEKDIIIQVVGKGQIKAEQEPIYLMIYNLVNNSIKYGKNGGFVRVVLEDKKIVVTDDGIGIPNEDIDRVFERFYRVDKSRNENRGGTGLGLAIVKHTAKKYGGTISIKSQLGIGTEIEIEF